MDNRNAPKPVKNTLLQNANYGFSFDTFLPNQLIVPVSKEEPVLPETAEIDSFLGQETSPAPPLASSNSIVNENLISCTVEESVPLVVPSSSSSNSIGAANRVEESFAENAAFAIPLDTPVFDQNPISSWSHTTSAHSAPLFNPAQFDQNLHPGATKAPSTFITSPTAVNSSVPPSATSAAHSYRRGNLKRPTYAPVPGLSSSSSSSFNVNQNCVPFSATAAPSVTSNFTPEFVPIAPATMSSIGQPSTTGPYSSPTTQNASSTSYIPEKPSMYRPVYHHWFYRRDTEKNSFYRGEPEIKSVWKPFSMADSLALESAFSLPTLNEDTVVATDGGRYDVNVMKREKVAVFWEERRNVVRRCSWFSKGPADSYFVPYEEIIAGRLEEEYKIGVETGEWNRRIDLGNEEVVMHHSSLITHQIKCTNVTIEVAADSSIPSALKPKVVKRGGFDDFDIDDGEPEKVDHLMFLVHGIGQFCDLKFRTIVEVVDEFRTISLQLTQSHFQESCELGEVNRIEILPVSWHKALHGDETGVDARVKNITLPSIPRMRDFANDTIADVLFYTSPVFCQVIINAVASEMNRLYTLFLRRNPYFEGKVSVGGHSLGSLILFDLLSNQPSTPSEPEPDIGEDLADEFDKRLVTATRRVSVITIGKAGTGQPLIKYPRLNFNPRFFFAFGSPIASFVATRSNEILGEDFHLPTCPGFFNIFHPYDPIAYRVEPLIIPSLSSVKPVQISHHKGRKRMHLELKDTVSHVGQRLIDTMKNTWNMVYHLAVNKSVDAAESVIHQEISQVLQTTEALANRPINPNVVPSEPVNETTDVKVGRLNGGRRVDYVLQEAPVEYFNEYLFALASHLCYWTSRDSMLLVLKEIYGDMGVRTDNQLPQTILPFDITDGQRSSNNPSREPTPVNPTSPFQENVPFGPPPTTSYARK